MSESDETPPEDSHNETPGHDEKYCTDCGSVIKKRAEICPECGVEQSGNSQEPAAAEEPPAQSTGLTDRRQYELEKVASQNKLTVALVSFLITPLGYWMVGKKMLAIVNLLTLNYFLLGPFVVPIHTYMMIDNAEEELRRAGVQGY